MKLKSGHFNMKVTVCFGDVRIVVPCGNGDLLIRELMDDALMRYKKAAGYSMNCNVFIRHLMLADGGILDEGDRVVDVVDDKDQIFADFKVDILDISDSTRLIELSDIQNTKYGITRNSQTPVCATTGSEMIKHQLHQPRNDGVEKPGTDLNSNWVVNSMQKNCDIPYGPDTVTAAEAAHSWTILPPADSSSCQQQTPIIKKTIKNSKDETKKIEVIPPDFSRQESQESVDMKLTVPAFIRDSSRKSLSNQLVMAKWLDAHDRTLDTYKNEEIKLEQPNVAIDSSCHSSHKSPVTWPTQAASDHLRQKSSENKEYTPSGWRSSFYGTATPSVIHSITAPQYQSLTSRKKRPAPEPPISKNTSSLFSSVPNSLKPTPASDFQSPVAHSIAVEEGDTNSRNSSLPVILIHGPSVEENKDRKSDTQINVQLPTGSHGSGSVKSSPDQKNPVNKLTPSKHGVLAPTNTRLIGNKIPIQLAKGANGLGFSITTRDNVAGSDCPIYIKNILPIGAAVEDGCLKAGDRLLEVNGMEMTGMTQNEAAQVLRSIPVNSIVSILVSRQVSPEDEIHPRLDVKAFDVSEGSQYQTKTNLCEDSFIPDGLDSSDIRFHQPSEPDLAVNNKKPDTGADNRILLTFNIPKSHSSGLSFSLQKVQQSGRDLGIFVQKAVLENNPLQVNDQLIEVNGVSLVGLTNSEAVDIVRKALKNQSSSFICLTVCRPKKLESPFFSPHVVADHETNISLSAQNLKNSANSLNSVSKLLPHFESCRTAEETDSKYSIASELHQVSQTLPLQMISSDYKESLEDDITQNTEKSMRTGNSRYQNESAGEHLPSDEDFIPDERLDDINSTPGFAREGFGRQSISEKRKGHADPSNLDTYQKIKQNKEKLTYDSASWDPRKSALHKSTGSRQEDLWPKTMIKKYKSMEDIHVVGQGLVSSEEQESEIHRVPGSNISFLVAVDRSYNSPTLNFTNQGEQAVNPNASESILTLRRPPFTSALTKSEKRKSDIDKIRSILKKGTDMLRLSKRQKSIDTKDVDEMRKSIHRSSVLGFLSSKKAEKLPQTRWLVDTDFSAEPAQSESGSLSSDELEVTHFGGECVTRVIKDSGELMRLKSSVADELEEKKSNQHSTKTMKLQQLRAEHQRRHRERQGQYPQEDMQDLFEKQLHDPEGNLMSEKSLVSTTSSSLQHLCSSHLDERLPRMHTRQRPQPISVQPGISEELEFQGSNPTPTSGYLEWDAQYPFTSDQDLHYLPSSYYDSAPDCGHIASRLPSVESNNLLNIRPVQSDLCNSSYDYGTALSERFSKMKLSNECTWNQQASSTLPCPTHTYVADKDQRQSFSEQLPAIPTYHYDQRTRPSDYGSIMSQSSHV